MTERGHWQRLRPLVAALAIRGIEVNVFTHDRFGAQVEAAGGRFVDLFARYPLEQADDSSSPFPCRFVSFAGHYASEVLRDVAELQPSLVVYDTFAVIGRVVGRALGVPYVNVCAGHNMDPSRFLPRLEVDPRVDLSESCHRAVDILRDSYGLVDASPFSYVSGLSPYLNIYCEPSAFLTEQERRIFEPIAFFGSLPPPEEMQEKQWAPRYFDSDGFNVYVSFGTVVWRYFAAEALATLTSLADHFAAIDGLRAVISLGRSDQDPATLTRSNVEVRDYVDQWAILQEADAFVTHNGLNSTHEAIFNLVPMVSNPFFSDQPSLAQKCRQLGLAVPLRGSDGPAGAGDVERAFVELSTHQGRMRANLEQARAWELDVIAGREEVVDRLLELV